MNAAEQSPPRLGRGLPRAGLGVLLLLAAAAGCGSGNEAPGPKRIVVLMNGNSPFWDAVRVGMQAAEKELRLGEAGLQVALDVNNATPQGQIDKLRQYATQSDIVAVGISATDAANAAIIDEMQRLRESGVHVITIDSDIDAQRFGDARYAFVGTDSRAAGRELGLALKNLVPQGGEFVTFVGRTTAQNAIDRVAGVVDGAGAGFKHLDNMGDQNDRSKAQQNVRDAISNHAALIGLVGIWSYNAPAIVDVVREQGVRKRVKVAVFDAEPLAVRYMGEGDIDAMVVQNPYQMGYQGVRLMKALVENDQATLAEMLPRAAGAGGDFYDTGVKLVVPDGPTPLKREMFAEGTEFLTLSEFRDWLDRYHLEGS